MESITFKYIETKRADMYVGVCNSTTIETVNANGRIEGRTVGTIDGQWIDRSFVREVGPVDLATVKEARIRMGWSVVP